MKNINKMKNGKITHTYYMLKKLSESPSFARDITRGIRLDRYNNDGEALNKMLSGGLLKRRRERNPNTNRMSFKYYITDEGRRALELADLRHQFPIGSKVYYDVYPDGINFLGVMTSEGIRAVGETRRRFERQGISIDVNLEDGVTNIRKRTETVDGDDEINSESTISPIMRAYNDVIREEGEVKPKKVFVKVKVDDVDSEWTPVNLER